MVIKRVLVTGASGFLGSHICESLHDAGYGVHALTRETSSLRWLDHPWLKIHTASLFNTEALLQIFNEVDAVIHSAGALWGEYHKINTEGSRSVARACIEAGIQKLVYISSLAAGGPGVGPYPRDENSPDNPISLYGHSKREAEEILRALSDRLEVVILRFPMIFGPRDPQTLRLFKSFKIFLNPSVGVRRRHISVIYVKDAARAAVAALGAEVKSGSRYEISDGRDYTFIKLFKLVGSVWGRPALRIPVPLALLMFVSWVVNDVLKGKTAFNPEQMGMFRKRFWLISPRRAIRELGWRPETDIRHAIKETIQWYESMKWL